MFKLISLAGVGYFFKNNIRQFASLILVAVLYAVLSDVIDTLKMPEYEYENKFIVIFLIYVFEVIVIVSALIFTNLTYTKVSAGSEVVESGEHGKSTDDKHLTHKNKTKGYHTKTETIIKKAENKANSST